MIDPAVAFSFAAGLVAAFNPCGFAMLPGYLSLFLGMETQAADHGVSPTAAWRALVVGGAVSAGFVAVFGLVGLVLTRASLSIVDYVPWLTIVVGLVLVALGVAMVRGYEPTLALPRLQRGGSGRGLGSMFLFGASYATVSLSCTLPVFLAAVSGTFTRTTLISGVTVFGAYAAGMGLVLVAVTLAIAGARSAVVGRLRGALPYVNRASGVVLVASGAYVAYYGYYELRTDAGADLAAGPVGLVGDLSARVSAWVDRVGAGRLGLVLCAVIIGVVLGGVVRGRRRRGGGPASHPAPGEHGGGSRPALAEAGGGDRDP